MTNPLYSETYLIRPDVGEFKNRQWRRWADGKWVDDDGNPDIAFMSADCSYPIVMYVQLPAYENLIWVWDDPKFYWHSQLVNGATDIGEYLREEHDNHINVRIGREAMHEQSSKHGVSNGRGPEIYRDNEWIREGKLWIKRTMELVTPPKNPVCYLCLNNKRGHRLEELHNELDRYEAEEEDLAKHISKLEIDLYDAQDALKHVQEDKLPEIRNQITSVEAEGVEVG